MPATCAHLSSREAWPELASRRHKQPSNLTFLTASHPCTPPLPASHPCNPPALDQTALHSHTRLALSTMSSASVQAPKPTLGSVAAALSAAGGPQHGWEGLWKGGLRPGQVCYTLKDCERPVQVTSSIAVTVTECHHQHTGGTPRRVPLTSEQPALGGELIFPLRGVLQSHGVPRSTGLLRLGNLAALRKPPKLYACSDNPAEAQSGVPCSRKSASRCRRSSGTRSACRRRWRRSWPAAPST